MYLLLSYLSTNFSQLSEHWQKHSVLRSEGKRGSDKPFVKELGGRLEIIDWSTKQIVWSMTVDSPAGIYQLSHDLIMVNSLRLGVINIVSLFSKGVVATIANPMFNKPHSLVRTSSGFLVASTGVDAIVEVNAKGLTLYSLFFTECGYVLDQLGRKRSIDFDINHQGVEYPSLHQTTHVNYARYADQAETKIVATLFHLGELVLIDKKSSSIKVILAGLKNPHNLKFAGDKQILCNTSANTILILNSAFEVVNQMGEGLGMSWVQDAVHCKTSDTLIVSDADNHRLLELDWNGDVIDDYQFSPDNRIYEVCEIENGDRLKGG